MLLAAAAVVVAATVITAAIVGISAAVATAAEQDQQDDDPAPVTATKTIIAHKKYLHRKIFEGTVAAHSMVFRGQKNVQAPSIAFLPESDIMAAGDDTYEHLA